MPGNCSQPTTALSPPPNTYLVAEFNVSGTQNYTCKQAIYTWLGIRATMRDLTTGQPRGTAYSAMLKGGDLGGVYQVQDFNTNNNNTIGSVTSLRTDLASSIPDPLAMPWIIRVTGEPYGTLRSVLYLWRHNTTGGIGPVAEACIDGQSPDMFIPFQAVYGFYSCEKQPSSSVSPSVASPPVASSPQLSPPPSSGRSRDTSGLPFVVGIMVVGMDLIRYV